MALFISAEEGHCSNSNYIGYTGRNPIERLYEHKYSEKIVFSFGLIVYATNNDEEAYSMERELIRWYLPTKNKLIYEKTDRPKRFKINPSKHQDIINVIDLVHLDIK